MFTATKEMEPATGTNSTSVTVTASSTYWDSTPLESETLLDKIKQIIPTMKKRMTNMHLAFYHKMHSTQSSRVGRPQLDYVLRRAINEFPYLGIVKGSGNSFQISCTSYYAADIDKVVSFFEERNWSTRIMVAQQTRSLLSGNSKVRTHEVKSASDIMPSIAGQQIFLIVEENKPDFI